MKASEVITNLHTDDVERAREFFHFLGLTQDGMNQGWVVRFRGRCRHRTRVGSRSVLQPQDVVVHRCSYNPWTFAPWMTRHSKQ